MSGLKDRKVAKGYTSDPSLVKIPNFCTTENNLAVIVTILKLRAFQIKLQEPKLRKFFFTK